MRPKIISKKIYVSRTFWFTKQLISFEIHISHFESLLKITRGNASTCVFNKFGWNWKKEDLSKNVREKNPQDPTSLKICKKKNLIGPLRSTSTGLVKPDTIELLNNFLLCNHSINNQILSLHLTSFVSGVRKFSIFDRGFLAHYFSGRIFTVTSKVVRKNKFRYGCLFYKLIKEGRVRFILKNLRWPKIFFSSYRLSTCLEGWRGSPVKHFREMTDASKVVIRGKRVNIVFRKSLKVNYIE